MIDRIRVDDTGSALVLALILIGIWSIAILAVVGIAEAGFGLTVAANDERERVYAADGGIEAAVTYLTVDWESWSSCPDVVYPGEDDPINVSVTCTSLEIIGYGGGEDVGEVVRVTSSVDGELRADARVRLDWPTPLDPPDPSDERRATATVLLWDGRP